MTFPPRVADEWATMRAVVNCRMALARIGDGEWKLMDGGYCKGQAANGDLAKRLRRIAELGSTDSVLVGIPRIYDGIPAAKRAFWTRYATEERARFYRGPAYHSAFVTRADHFPALDCPEYWALVRSIWAARPVLFVKGIKAALVDNAARVDLMPVPPRDAWSAYPGLLADCRAWSAANRDGVVVLCVGATATVLAWELGHDGTQALDLGHMPNYYLNRGSRAEGEKAA